VGITPVTVLTGFLGSGKTTLLARLLSDPRFADTAVVLNEEGEARLGHGLVRSANGNDTMPVGGCLCCRLAGDVVRALRELHFERLEGRVAPFRRVVIETAGLADPGPLLATLAQFPLAAARYAVQGVVAAVDARHGMATLDRHREAGRQVAMADRIIVTKCDLATPGSIDALQARLGALSPGASVLRSSGADLDPARLVDTGLYSRQAPDATGWLAAGAWRSMAPSRHGAGYTAFAWTDPEPRPWADVERALAALLARHGERVLRLKGLVSVAGEPGPRAVHAVGHTLYPSARLAAWPDADRSTRLAFTGLGLEERDVAAILRFHPHDPSHPR
jgi:G3E family GTPase